jgi:predicted phosphodiesterase
MRVVLLSDIHANLAALEAVLGAAEAAGCNAAWHLGDVVGYGPQPNEVVARLRELGAPGVMGNHDAAAAGLIGLAEFNDFAAEAARWTARAVGEATREYLAGLPRRLEQDGVTLVHGTLRDPVWEYLTTYEAAAEHFAMQETLWSVVGHTHLPLAVFDDGEGFEVVVPEDGMVLELGERRACLNPGGVGQPRDGDPRSAYAILDLDERTISFHRVAYDIAATQRLMVEAGLPQRLVSRLAAGR